MSSKFQPGSFIKLTSQSPVWKTLKKDDIVLLGNIEDSVINITAVYRGGVQLDLSRPLFWKRAFDSCAELLAPKIEAGQVWRDSRDETLFKVREVPQEVSIDTRFPVELVHLENTADRGQYREEERTIIAGILLGLYSIYSDGDTPQPTKIPRSQCICSKSRHHRPGYIMTLLGWHECLDCYEE